MLANRFSSIRGAILAITVLVFLTTSLVSSLMLVKSAAAGEARVVDNIVKVPENVPGDGQ